MKRTLEQIKQMLPHNENWDGKWFVNVMDAAGIKEVEKGHEPLPKYFNPRFVHCCAAFSASRPWADDTGKKFNYWNLTFVEFYLDLEMSIPAPLDWNMTGEIDPEADGLSEEAFDEITKRLLKHFS